METEIEVSLPMPNGETFGMKVLTSQDNGYSETEVYYRFYYMLRTYIDETVMKELRPSHKSQLDLFEMVTKDYKP